MNVDKLNEILVTAGNLIDNASNEDKKLKDYYIIWEAARSLLNDTLLTSHPVKEEPKDSDLVFIVNNCFLKDD